MTTDQHQTRFYERFDGVRRRMRRTSALQVIGLGLTAASAVVLLLAALDYRWELGATSRTMLLAVLGGAVVLGVLAGICRVLARWGGPTTASAIEHRFPELGQSVRTTVQFGADEDFDASEAGVAPTLVEALETTTLHRTAPLPLETIVPLRRSLLAVATGVVLLGALGASTVSHWEWRTAVRRALLADVPYTTVAVTPGNVEVDAGRDVSLQVELQGRTDRTVVLQSRPTGTTQPWSEYELASETAGPAAVRARAFHTEFTHIGEPLEYRVIAGPAMSDVYTVGVRYPIAIKSIEARVEPPAYTGLPVKTVDDGNVTALSGSHVGFKIVLDRAPTSAEAIIETIGGNQDERADEQHLPLTIEERTLRLEFNVVDDLQWSLVAESRDGTRLAENSFRIRVRHDQPPRVTFADPDEDLEVHSLAEVLMRIRAQDDYGLSRSGIVFQINNGEEHTLLQEDFPAVEAAAAELSAEAEAAPRTLAVLEDLLPLEYFSLTQKDCVVYYAFADDNYPDGAHHGESDLRFVDIRPFKQTFRLREPGEGGDGGGGGFTSLDELIRRQRYALNRTLRLDRRSERFGPEDLTTIDRLVDYQSEIADLTRELAENLVARGADDVDVLFQAEAAMVNAADSLQLTRFDTAFIQQKDAQQYLVEARNKLEILLQQAQNNAELRQALGLLNSRLMQKLRRMNDERKQETREAIVERLQRLAQTEGLISEELYAAAANMQSAAANNSSPDESDAPQGSETAETEDTASTTDAAETEDTASTTDLAEGSGESTGSSESTGEQDAPAKRSLKELETAQYDVVTEARDVQQLLNDLEEITDLARERMESAVQTADGAARTLAAGDTGTSADQTGAAAEVFAELARQAEALLAEEAAEQVAMSRDTAAEIADRQRSLATELDEEQSSSSGGGNGTVPVTEEERQESRRLAERARTLEDVLQAVAGSTNLEDGETADNVAEIIAENDVPKAIERTGQLPANLETGSTPETQSELKDLADRLELTAAELDRLYRSIVTPRMELLRELEEEAVALEEQMPQIAATQDIQEWERGLKELAEDVDQAGAGGAPTEELLQILGGAGDRKRSSWGRSPSGAYSAPVAYSKNLHRMIEDLQQQIQELVLNDLLSDHNEVVPEKYEPLIERYLKVLSETAGNNER